MVVVHNKAAGTWQLADAHFMTMRAVDPTTPLHGKAAPTLTVSLTDTHARAVRETMHASFACTKNCLPAYAFLQNCSLSDSCDDSQGGKDAQLHGWQQAPDNSHMQAIATPELTISCVHDKMTLPLFLHLGP